MNFEDKKIRVSAFSINGNWGTTEHENALAKAREKRASKLDDLPYDLSNIDIGWTSGRVELDTELKNENCRIGEELYLTLRIAKRVIPSGIFKALLRKKMAEYREANNATFVPKRIRKELKEDTENTLIHHALPAIKCIPVVIRPNGKVYTGAVSFKEQNAVSILFCNTFGVDLLAKTPNMMMEGKEIPVETPIGCEFLTDLLRRGETESCDFLIEPPLDLISVNNEKPCTRALAVGDMAVLSVEVRAALQDGKLLKKANLSVSGTNMIGYEDTDRWTFVLHGETLAMTSLDLPETEEMNVDAHFIERLDMIEAIFGWVYSRFGEFKEKFASPEYAESKTGWIKDR